jgi:hypothetical protein
VYCPDEKKEGRELGRNKRETTERERERERNNKRKMNIYGWTDR